MVTCSAIEWFRHFGEFAVSTHKPIFVRWAEEAEAKQVCLWAGLERDAAPTQVQLSSHRLLPRRWRAWALLLRRFRGLLQPADANIDGEVNVQGTSHRFKLSGRPDRRSRGVP